MTGRLICGDALAELRKLPDASIDLVVTSPPYADARKRQYGGTPPDEYVAWYTPIAAEIKRVLAERGSYILNIKESRTADGQRSLYVHDLVRAHVKEAGLRWHDTFIWYKTSAYPGNNGSRLPDAWEPCWQFARHPKPYIDKTANRTPIRPQTRSKREYIRRLTAEGTLRERAPSYFTDTHDSGMTSSTSAMMAGDTAQARNVIPIGVLGGAGHGLKHPAMFPERLPAWFVRLLCPRDGTVLDPFAGSGTTPLAAERLGRRWIAIDKKPEYVEIARKRLAVQHEPLTPGALPGTADDDDEEAAAP